MSSDEIIPHQATVLGKKVSLMLQQYNLLNKMRAAGSIEELAKQLGEDLEFNKWPKIPRFTNEQMIITEKLDGTNGQIVFKDGLFRVGSRTRWITPEDDNFGFAKWCHEHKEDLFEALGEGRHYGEWVGKGIQRGYGMEDRKFYLFNTNFELSPDVTHLVELVPRLYKGEIRFKEISSSLFRLGVNGSAVNGFKNPEGIVVHLNGTRYKIFMEQLTEIEKLEL